jgi:hypothetical protein
MGTASLNELMEAFNAVYDNEIREEYLEEDYAFLDDFDNEEIEDIVEEVIYELIDEGYEVEELEEIFEETFLTEAKVTIGTGSLRAAKVRVASRKSAKRKARKEKIQSAARGVLSSIKKGVKRAAKKVGLGAEKAKQAMQGRDRSAERSTRRAKAKMKSAAVKNLRKAVTGKAKAPKAVEKKVSRKDVTGSAGAGAAGTIRSKSSGGSGGGPSSKGRALPPKGATSRTDAGNLRKPSQVTFALSRAAKAGRKRMEKLNNSFDMFDVVADFLISEGLADDINEANWIMVNEVTAEDIEQIVELYELEELFGLGKKKDKSKPVEYMGRSMKKPDPDEKKGYTVDRRRPEASVTGFEKGGKTWTVKTRGRV